jgi:ABC-type xylose transport system permease subunit
MKQIVSRITAPTPSFFKKLRNIGLALAAVATAIVTAPIAMPAIVVTIAGYLAVAGGVLTAVSQTAVESE